jgi:hypothetical protein
MVGGPNAWARGMAAKYSANFVSSRAVMLSLRRPELGRAS